MISRKAAEGGMLKGATPAPCMPSIIRTNITRLPKAPTAAALIHFMGLGLPVAQNAMIS